MNHDTEIPESQTSPSRAGGAAPDVPAGSAGGSPVSAILFRLFFSSDSENAEWWAERRAFDAEMIAIREKAKTDAS